jgi:hypothetical protein
VVIFSFFRIIFLFFYSKKAYFLSVSHPAALGAAATVRGLVPLYLEARIFFQKTYGYSNTALPSTNRCDSSGDMPRPGGLPPRVFVPTMTNANQPEPDIKESKLNGNNGIIYQAKPANPG